MSGHIVPLKTNLKTFGVLVFLTIVTVYTALYVDIGPLNLPLAMLIAGTKAAVVAIWFMHLKYDSMMNRSVIFFAFAFLALLCGISALDIFTRV